MYNLDSIVQVVSISVEDHSLVAVLAREASVREAFGIARAALAATDAEWSIDVVILPVGDVPPMGEILPVDSDWSPSVRMFDDDNTADVAVFFGNEVSDDETLVWEDGFSRAFVPYD